LQGESRTGRVKREGDGVMKVTVKGEGDGSDGGKSDPSILYTCMKIE
jgi:hypothetical protein